MKAKCCRNIISKTTESYNGHRQAMLNELDELDRLANIGLAIEKIFEEKGIISLLDKTPMNQTRGVIGGIDLEDIEQLLIWAEREEEYD